MRDVVIVEALRTPIGNFLGGLATVSASQLGAGLIQQLLARHDHIGQQIDQVILGQVLTAGAGQNPARQAALQGGLDHSVPALTINHVCGSGLKAVQLAWQAIALGDGDCIIAGGQESMSQAPHLLPNSRGGKPMGPWALQDSVLTDGLQCAFNDYHMGITAENIAKQWHIDRGQQDVFAAQSQAKAQQAIANGYFDAEIVPVATPTRKNPDLVVAHDEFPRAGVDETSLGKLRPAFAKDGTVTAGNASGINDGAAMVILMSAERAQQLNLTPLATIRAASVSGVDPKIMGIGPVSASRQCLAKAGWSVADLDLIEANEAFAVQALAVNHDMGWDTEKVNISGGAIALGHPIGASGCRVLVTLLHNMQRTKARRGLATLCIGGGQGIALAVERTL